MLLFCFSCFVCCLVISSASCTPQQQYVILICTQTTNPLTRRTTRFFSSEHAQTYGFALRHCCCYSCMVSYLYHTIGKKCCCLLLCTAEYHADPGTGAMTPQNHRQCACRTTAVRYSGTREYYHIVLHDLQQYEADDTTKSQAVCISYDTININTAVRYSGIIPESQRVLSHCCIVRSTAVLCR